MQKKSDKKETDTKAEHKDVVVAHIGQLPVGDAEIQAIVAAGADFKDGGREVALVSFPAGSNAHKKYIQVASNLDPFVLAAWIGPINGVIPPLAQAGPLCHEANTIINAYQPLLAAAFLPGAPLPPAVVIPGILLGPAWYHHAQIACTKVIERIQNPGPGFPSINALGGGTYICSIQYTHANCIVVIAIYKA